MMPPEALRQRFIGLLEKHVSRLIVRGRKANGLCPFHPDRNPSFTADLEKLVWFCFPCGQGGGVRDFARLVGEGWTAGKREGGTPALHRERAQMAIAARRRAAEATARAILQRRREEYEDALWGEWCTANRDATEAAELLTIFFRHRGLAQEFSDLVRGIESDYGDAVFRRSVIEFRASGEGWQ